MTNDVYVFLWACWSLVSVLWRGCLSCPFKKLVYFLTVELWRVLYKFWIEVLYQRCVLQIFPPSLWLYTLLTVPFKVWTFFILMMFNLPMFSFVIYVFGVLRSVLPTLRSQWFYHMFSSGRFIMLGFTFWFMIHLELIFPYSENYRSKFIIFKWKSNCSTPFIGETILCPLK